MILRLVLAYDGTAFRGWAAQPGLRTVQGVLQEALDRVYPGWSGLHVAGRTDAGVHALGQVVHFDLERDWDPFKVREALNYHTKPHPVAILTADLVDETFEARFSAIARHYEYRILNRRARPGLDMGRVWHVPVHLDADRMHEAAQLILGKHDFTTFRATECQAKTAVKTLNSLDVFRRGETVEITAGARSFLHNQVRSMVGSLKLVGEGKWSENDLVAALAAADRAACGPVAPPWGLYLAAVRYD